MENLISFFLTKLTDSVEFKTVDRTFEIPLRGRTHDDVIDITISKFSEHYDRVLTELLPT